MTSDIIMEYLDRKLSEQISSEQVIPSIAHAIKELVENSIDAGASSIEVLLSHYGIEKIEVIDDGMGIHVEDHTKLAVLGSTSKIQCLEDLEQVSSLGFRGQSLAALARLSDMEIRTSHNSSSYLLKFSRFGELLEQSYNSWKAGTSVTIKNIFRGLPVRQKDMFSKKACYLKHAVKIIEEFSLCFNHLKFSLVHLDNSKKEVLVRPSPGDTSRVIQKLFKLCDLIEINLSFKQLNAQVFLTNPYEKNSLKTDRVFTFLNNRPINAPRKLFNCVNGLYKQFSDEKMLIVIKACTLEKINPNHSVDKRDVDFPDLQLFIDNLLAQIYHIFQEKSKIMDLPREIETLKRKPEDSIPSENKKLRISTSVFSRHCSSSHISDIYHTAEDRNESMRDSSLNDIDQDEILIYSDNEREQNLMGSSDINRINTGQESDLSFIRREVNEEQELQTNQPFNITEHQNQDHPQETSQESDLSFIRSEVNEEQELQTNQPFNITEHQNQEAPQEISSPERAAHNVESEPFIEILEMNPYKEILEMNPYKERTVQSFQTSQSNKVYKKPMLKWDISQLRRKEKSGPQPLNLSKYCSVSNISSISDTKSFKANFQKSYFKELKVIGQFNRGFILGYLEQSKDLFIIDQHAANEKYLFEMMEKSTTIHSQPYLIPQVLSLNVSDEMNVSNNLHAFALNGFGLIYNEKSPPGNKISVNAVPFSNDTLFDIAELEEMIGKLSSYSEVSDAHTLAMLIRPEKYRKMLASRACRKAVMIGDLLDERHMKQILEELAGLKQPWNCPHGRPTLRLLYNFTK